MWGYGERFACADVLAVGCLGRGQALIEDGERAAGLSLLDEAMVAVAGREVSAPMAGLVACAAIATCQQIFDLARAREWNSAMTRWCDTQSGLVPYRDQCPTSDPRPRLTPLSGQRRAARCGRLVADTDGARTSAG